MVVFGFYISHCGINIHNSILRWIVEGGTMSELILNTLFSSVMERLFYHIELQSCLGHKMAIHPEIWNHMSDIMRQDTHTPSHRSSHKGAVNCSTVHYSINKKRDASPSSSGKPPLYVPEMVVNELDFESLLACLGSSRQPLVQLPPIFPACIANTLPRALPAPDISVGMPLLLLCQSP